MAESIVIWSDAQHILQRPGKAELLRCGVLRAQRLPLSLLLMSAVPEWGFCNCRCSGECGGCVRKAGKDLVIFCFVFR